MNDLQKLKTAGLGPRVASNYDGDAEAILDAIGEALGCEPHVVRMAFLRQVAVVERNADIRPARALFELTTAAGVELSPLALTSGVAVSVDIFATQDGRQVGELVIRVDGGATTSGGDDDVLIIDLNGVAENPIRYFAQPGDPARIPFHGVWVRGTHTLTLSAPSAGAGADTVRAYFDAVAGPVHEEHLRARRTAARQVHGDGFGLRKFRGLMSRSGASGAAKAVTQVIGATPGAMGSRMGPALMGLRKFAGFED